MSAGRDAVGARMRALYTGAAAEHACEFVDGGRRRWHTWGQFAGVDEALAEICMTRMVPEDVALAVVVRQRPAMVAAELAALANGRGAVLLSPLQSDLGLATDIAQLRPAVLVAHTLDWDRPHIVSAAVANGALGIEVDDDLEASVRVEAGVVHGGPATDAAVTVQTSGTTGPPKRLPVTWDTFVELGGGPPGRPAVSNRGALILSLPLITLGGLLSVTRLVFGGRPMAMMERFDVRTWAELVREHRPKVIGAPPPVVKMILDAGIDPACFEGVTAYTTSSAALAPEIATEFERRYGIPVLLGYGATEFLNSVSGWTGGLWAEFGATKLGSVGRALPGVRLRVVDPDNGEELPADSVGLLEVDPPQRAGHLADGWLRTADRARIDTDGFLWILGRNDDVIVRGGFKVDLQQVERTLVEHPAVAGACAVGLPDERLGQVPGAVVTLGDGASADEDELIAWVRERLPAYAVPVTVRVVDTIPRTSTFKPARAEVEDLLTVAR